MSLTEDLYKALGLVNGQKVPSPGKDTPESKLWTFLTYHTGHPKLDNVPGSIKIEPAGHMWKVTLTSDNLWKKKTFYTADLNNLVADCELAIADLTIPFELYKSKRQRKNPERPDSEKA